MQQNYEISLLRKEAKTRWLKPSEVLFILQNHEKYTITSEPPQKPPSGSLFLFNRRVLRFFRKDGHSWRRKKDGRTVGEAHERLKVANIDALNCYYAHGDQNPYFQRRSYWMLNPEYEHIVLVHYREVSEGRYITGQNSNVNQTSTNSNSNSSNQTHNSFISIGEVSSKIETQNPKFENNNNNNNNNNKPELNQALRQLAVQLSLEDYDDYIYLQEKIPENISTGKNGTKQKLETKGSPSWKDMFELNSDSNLASNSNSNINFFEKDRFLNSSQYIETNSKYPQIDDTELRLQLSATKRFLLGSDSLDSPSKTLTLNNNQTLNENQTLIRKYSSNEWMRDFMTNIESNNNNNCDFSNALNETRTPNNQTLIRKYSSNEWMKDFVANIESRNNNGIIEVGNRNNDNNIEINNINYNNNDNNFSNTWFDQGQLSGAQKMRFCIRDVSPEWAFSSESTKVIITGYFESDPSDPLAIMFNDIEVPVEIIQEGTLKCYTPPQIAPGKASICITSANHEPCSQILDFEIRDSNSLFYNSSKSDEELLLVSKLAQLLVGKTKVNNKGVDFDWIVEELLREKLQGWLEMKKTKMEYSVLSKKERGIIHFISGLGYEWALGQVLDLGVGINFRDENGWTALHWAAYFGREKMVAALLAKGGSPTAVTDPNPQDPLGKTPGFLASAQAHMGLAAYLSESALTSHLSSLRIEKTGRAELEQSGAATWRSDEEDALSAVRNAAQAAARIQAAFKAFSFRKRRQKSILKEDGLYGINQEDFNEISKMQMLNHKHDKNDKAALSIQNKYRGYKSRKNYLTMRQHVVKIQALVRGHQVRKKYHDFIWTVSIVEKAVLRWRRKGAGLRGFKNTEMPLEDKEEEEVAKLFRRQKVDNALEEAVSRVLTIVDSPSAREQYRRMIERFKEAKEEINTSEETNFMF